MESKITSMGPVVVRGVTNVNKKSYRGHYIFSNNVQVTCLHISTRVGGTNVFLHKQ